MNTDHRSTPYCPAALAPPWSSRLNRCKSSIDGFWRYWLLDSDSLSLKLDSLDPGKFRVKVLKQSVARATPLECRELGLRWGQPVWAREVDLYVGQNKLVQARTVIPLANAREQINSVKRLNNKPIGQLLFRCSDPKRSDIRVSSYRSQDGRALWIRRSVFIMSRQPLMISECFGVPFQKYVEQQYLKQRYPNQQPLGQRCLNQPHFDQNQPLGELGV